MVQIDAGSVMVSALLAGAAHLTAEAAATGNAVAAQRASPVIVATIDEAIRIQV